MKATGHFISTLLVIDTFLVSFYAGFNSRHVLVVDPKLPPVAEHTKKAESQSGDKKPAATEDKGPQSEKSDKQQSTPAGTSQENKPSHKSEHKKGSSAKKSKDHGATGKHSAKKENPD